jgi:hypothetical protein
MPGQRLWQGSGLNRRTVRKSRFAHASLQRFWQQEVGKSLVTKVGIFH